MDFVWMFLSAFIAGAIVGQINWHFMAKRWREEERDKISRL